jgi:hypothetical protein
MTKNSDHIHPTAYAFKENLTFNDIIPASELQSKISMFLFDLSEELKRSGYVLIGHIKGLIDADDKGHIMFSTTSFNEKTRFKGKLFDEITKAALTVNVIMYGIEQKIIKTMFQNVFNKHFYNGGEKPCAKKL